jgi:hypothetical protein
LPPDLTVDAIQFPPAVSALCPTPIVVVVRNIGSHPAPSPFEVCLAVAAGAEEPFAPQYRRIARGGDGGVLGPGQTVVVTFEVMFPCRTQSWVTVETDCSRLVPGNLRTRPRLAIPIAPIGLVPWLFTDMRIGLQDASGAIIWDPPQTCANRSVVIQVTVTNRGCADTVPSVTELTVNDPQTQVAAVSWPTPVLTPGAMATFLHSLQVPSPAPSQLRFEACADKGRVVTGQCDTSGMCRTATLPVSTRGSPLLTFAVDPTVDTPGSAPKISWELKNDCFDLGSITAEVRDHLSGGVLYRTLSPIPVPPFGSAGEYRKQTTVPASVASSFWATGVVRPLELRITGTGADGGPFSTTANFQVIIEPGFMNFFWRTGPTSFGPGLEASWKRPYSVIGDLLQGTRTSVTPTAITIREHLFDAPDASADVVRSVDSPLTAIGPRGSAPHGLFGLVKDWIWIDPVTFDRIGPTQRLYVYTATFMVQDEFGNAYPEQTTTPRDLTVGVFVSGTKLADQQAARGCMQAAVILIATIIGAVLGGFALWAQAIRHKAWADDPPAPDFDYQDRVTVTPRTFGFDRADASPAMTALFTLIEVLERIGAAEEAMGLIHAKILGAHVDRAVEALQMQAEDYRSALAVLSAAAEQVPPTVANAVGAMGEDERFDPRAVTDAWEAWRRGESRAEVEEAWREAELPEEALRDLAERAERFESLPALQEVLPRMAAVVAQLAEAARSESDEVLSLAEDA